MAHLDREDIVAYLEAKTAEREELVNAINGVNAEIKVATDFVNLIDVKSSCVESANEVYECATTIVESETATDGNY